MDTFTAMPYVHWHWVSVSVPNLIMIGVMVLVFALAVLFQMPTHRDRHDRP